MLHGQRRAASLTGNKELREAEGNKDMAWRLHSWAGPVLAKAETQEKVSKTETWRLQELSISHFSKWLFILVVMKSRSDTAVCKPWLSFLPSSHPLTHPWSI